MKSELHHFCVHFLFSLPLELSFLSLSQAATDSHVLRQESFTLCAQQQNTFYKTDFTEKF